MTSTAEESSMAHVLALRLVEINYADM
uniref:Uncharacterized protein n=1 Tax=Arundo donax TaxID=35708 RepID=A0A0A9QK44_ARUDO